MLDSTKANEFASQCGNEVYSEGKICFNVAGITSRIALLFQDQVNNLVIIMSLGIIFVFHTLSLLGILVTIEREMYLVVLIFLY